MIGPGQHADLLLEAAQFAQQHLMNGDQGLRNRLESRMISRQLRYASSEALRRCRASFKAEPAQNAAKAHLDIVKLRLHKLSPRQQRPNLLRRRRFAMHGLEPAKTQKLGDAACVLAIRLNRHRLEGVTDTPRLKKLHLKTRFLKTSIKPLREGARLSPMRAASKPKDRKNKIKASGSLATFASRTILPVPSTTQTLEASNDTSIPA